MEGKNSLGYSSSSSSFTTDLFGSKDSSPSSSSGIFDAIFAPSSKKVLGRDFLLSEKTGQREGKLTGKTGNDSDMTEEKIHVPLNEDGTPLYGEKGQPCHYSSSIYYGGQDIYSSPKNNQSTSGYSTNQFYKKEGEDDSNSASRGNWWQGSLYY